MVSFLAIVGALGLSLCLALVGAHGLLRVILYLMTRQVIRPGRTMQPHLAASATQRMAA
jgi:hypothetical protein